MHDYLSFYTLCCTLFHYKLSIRIKATPCKKSIQVLNPSSKTLPGYRIGSNYRAFLLQGQIYKIWFQTQKSPVEFYNFRISKQLFFLKETSKYLSQVLSYFLLSNHIKWMLQYLEIFNMKNKIFSQFRQLLNMWFMNWSGGRRREITLNLENITPQNFSWL